MSKPNLQIREKISGGDLKVTPQRVAILETLTKMANHPTADQIYCEIKKTQPNISLGTVYKTLETLAQQHIINKVKSDTGMLMYDAITEHHHHVFCSDTNQIADFFDAELDELLAGYFKDKNIPGFNIEDLKLHIVGRYEEEK